jgi:hypothetical protein
MRGATTASTSNPVEGLPGDGDDLRPQARYAVIEHFVIDPVRGEFDVKAAEQLVQTLKYVARDPHWSNTFLASVDEESLQDYLEARRANPDQFPYSAIQIGLGPTRMWIVCTTLLNDPGRAFVTWLRNHYDVRFLDEELNDLTDNVDANLNYLFGTPP